MTKTEWFVSFMVSAIPLAPLLAWLQRQLDSTGVVQIGFAFHVAIWVIFYIWSHIYDSDKVTDTPIGDQIGLQLSNRDANQGSIILNDDDSVELHDISKEKAIIVLAKDRKRLLLELQEASRWVPYQDGSLMKWGKN